ncbi:MAG TPA: GNAT family N-acetyltransferase [Nitrososphaerales archaeon]|nr:GNAT family N-acetyltransferase [Nitrososphaerales archaeon]
MRGNPKGIVIRLATRKDLDVLMNQRHRMFEDIRHRTPAELKRADSIYRKWVIKMSRKKRFVGFLAVKENGESVGGGCVWIRETQPSPSSGPRLQMPYLLSMYTKPRYRGRGIATSIVKEAMKWSKKKGFKMMTLHASEFGKPVYTKIGWKRTWEMRVDLSKFSPKDFV